MVRAYSNTAVSTALTADPGAAGTTFNVGATTGWVSVGSSEDPPFAAVVNTDGSLRELVTYTGTTGTTLTGVTRGQGGTSGVAHPIGTKVEHTFAAIDARAASGENGGTLAASTFAGVELGKKSGSATGMVNIGDGTNGWQQELNTGSGQQLLWNYDTVNKMNLSTAGGLSLLAGISAPSGLTAGTASFSAAAGANIPAGQTYKVGSIPAQVKVTSDLTNSTVTLASITGLTFTAAANTAYCLRATLVWQSAALTTGVQWGITLPTSPTHFTAVWETQASDTTWSISTTRAAGGNAVTAATAAVTTKYIATMEAILLNGANSGTVQMQFRSEVAASAITVFAGSTLRID